MIIPVVVAIALRYVMIVPFSFSISIGTDDLN